MEKEEFLSRVREQIDSEKKYAALLDEAPKKLAASRKLLFILSIIFFVAVFISVFQNGSLEGVLLVWITSVFILYMVNFVLMMLPSLGSDADIKIIDKPLLEVIRDFLRLANILKTVHKNKITLIEFFWNAFIINTKALTKAFSILFISNVFCAGLMFLGEDMHWTTFLLLVAQTVIILLMYYKISKAVPGTPGFFTKYGIPEERMGLGKGAIVWLSIAMFSVITVLILVGGMMLPGRIFEEYLSGVTATPLHYPLILAATLIFMLFWMRYQQGVGSVRVMREMNATHLKVLQDDLLPKAEAAEGVELSKLKRRFVLLTMNKLLVQEYFNRYPVYLLMPNFFVVLDKVSQDVLNESADEEKKLKDLL